AALGAMAGPDDADVVAALEAQLDNESPSVGSAAAIALARLAGKQSDPRRLVKLLGDRDFTEAWGTAFALLARLGPFEKDAVRLRLRDSRSGARQQMLTWLSAWPGALDSLLPDVLSMLTADPKPGVREQALTLLAERRAAANVVLPILFD